MDCDLSEHHPAIVDGVMKVCDRFGDDYWIERKETKSYPYEFHKAMADGGRLGITMPEALAVRGWA